MIHNGKSTKKALLIIAIINTLLMLGAIAVEIIITFTMNLSFEIYLPLLVVCTLVTIMSNALLWRHFLKEMKK